MAKIARWRSTLARASGEPTKLTLISRSPDDDVDEWKNWTIRAEAQDDVDESKIRTTRAEAQGKSIDTSWSRRAMKRVLGPRELHPELSSGADREVDDGSQRGQHLASTTRAGLEEERSEPGRAGN
jgi:hypothetical protein